MISILQSNIIKLEDGINEQKAVIAQQQEDFEAIIEVRDELEDVNRMLETANKNLKREI